MKPGVAIAALLLAGCGGGGISRGQPIETPDDSPELVYCRFDRDGPEAGHGMRTAKRSGLANERVRDRPGAERGVRVHPDGVRIVFSRETDGVDSREIFLAHLDGSASESRLTADRDVDDSPCWSGDGERVLFSSDRGATGFRLWSMDLRGDDLRLLHDEAAEQLDPDARGRLVAYSRHDPLAPAPRAGLWLFDTESLLATQLTDGGTGSADGVPGDCEPAFSPDGRSIVFTRSTSGDDRRLMRVDLATHDVAPLGDGAGSDRWPRWSPAGDAIVVARRRPLDGVHALQLFEVDATGGDPVSIVPNETFDHPGFDPLPSFGARPELAEPATPDFAAVSAELAFGTGAGGQTEALELDDGRVVTVYTAEFSRRQRGGLRVEVPLQVDEPLTIGRISVSMRAAISRADGDPLVRLALYNTIEDRNDTVLERAPEGTALESYAFSTQSLAHVSRTGAIVLTVIADLPDGDIAELAIDSVSVEVRTRR